MISNLKFIKAVTTLMLLLSLTGCEKALDLKNPSANATAVYDDAWRTMDRNYALFSIKGINWDSVYKQVRPQISADLSNDELFKKISQTLESLKDGHVTMISTRDTFTYQNFYKAYPLNFNFKNIEKNYLKNQYKQRGPLLYKIVDSVGYVYYSSFRNNISEAELDDIFSDLTATKGLIIDVRSNTGGSLFNVEKFFSRFINTRKLVKYEKRKKGPGHDDFYDKEAVYISPSGQYYNKPVALLTNRKCFSACNDFVLYMSYLPNVRIIGDQTGGGGAIPADYLLLNGWKLQYSSSVTLSPDNLPVENGVIPDFNIEITQIQDMAGLDPILEKAYELLK
jgi:Peptidase family S41/Tricorn protease C1 domain